MKIISVMGQNAVYTSNVYLTLGDWKRIEDVNTLVDVGSDPSIVNSILRIPTGVGKKPVEQVILTHSHSDHTQILPLIRRLFNPRVYAFSPFLEGVDHVVKNGDILRIGDRFFEVIHVPGHTEDSICLYNEQDGALFVGDANLMIRSEAGEYDIRYVRSLEALCRREVKTIYPGHGKPVVSGAASMLHASLNNVRRGMKGAMPETRPSVNDSLSGEFL